MKGRVGSAAGKGGGLSMAVAFTCNSCNCILHFHFHDSLSLPSSRQLAQQQRGREGGSMKRSLSLER